MSVKVIKGDLVASYKNNELDAYAHQANCFCRMGRGIAPLLVKANPEVLRVDKETLEGGKHKLGTFSRTSYDGNPLIYNVYGQYHWSKYKVAPNRNTDYTALREGLLAVKCDLLWVKLEYNYERNMTLGLPLIGCGLAGGDWDGVVFPMIKEIFEDNEIDVTIFVL